MLVDSYILQKLKPTGNNNKIWSLKKLSGDSTTAMRNTIALVTSQPPDQHSTFFQAILSVVTGTDLKHSQYEKQKIITHQ